MLTGASYLQVPISPIVGGALHDFASKMLLCKRCSLCHPGWCVPYKDASPSLHTTAMCRDRWNRENISCCVMLCHIVTRFWLVIYSTSILMCADDKIAAVRCVLYLDIRKVS